MIMIGSECINIAIARSLINSGSAFVNVSSSGLEHIPSKNIIRDDLSFADFIKSDYSRKIISRNFGLKPMCTYTSEYKE